MFLILSLPPKGGIIFQCNTFHSPLIKNSKYFSPLIKNSKYFSLWKFCSMRKEKIFNFTLPFIQPWFQSQKCKLWFCLSKQRRISFSIITISLSLSQDLPVAWEAYVQWPRAFVHPSFSETRLQSQDRWRIRQVSRPAGTRTCSVPWLSKPKGKPPLHFVWLLCGIILYKTN